MVRDVEDGDTGRGLFVELQLQQLPFRLQILEKVLGERCAHGRISGVDRKKGELCVKKVLEGINLLGDRHDLLDKCIGFVVLWGGGLQEGCQDLPHNSGERIELRLGQQFGGGQFLTGLFDELRGTVFVGQVEEGTWTGIRSNYYIGILEILHGGISNSLHCSRILMACSGDLNDTGLSWIILCSSKQRPSDDKR